MEKVKVYVAFGINRLINAAGPCGVFINKEDAEKSAEENCDTWKVQEYELDLKGVKA